MDRPVKNSARLHCHDAALTYGGLLRLADPESDARGLLFVDVDVTAEKEATPGTPLFDLLFKNANGTVDVAPAGFLGTLIKWYTSLIYVPYKWLSGERFLPDGAPTCFDAMDWQLTPGLP